MQENQLKPFRVTLNEEPGDKFTIVFECEAEDSDHAAEQAGDAYPGCTIINCTEFEGNLPLDSWLRNLRPGDDVWWNDPDHHKSSGIYRIHSIHSDEGILFDDTILMLVNEAGSNSEVFARELSPAQPDGLFPVIDGDCGNGDIYGFAASKEVAIEVGNETFADEVVDAYLAENVTLRDGKKVDKAWVALTSKLPSKARIRLTLDVVYDLNGESAISMISRLEEMVAHAIGEGMLTGSSTAEVAEFATKVVEIPATAEEEIAEFMLKRIENGDLELGDIPIRLARYGLMDPADFINEMRERIEVMEEKG